MDIFSGKKSYAAAIGLLLTAIGGVLSGIASPMEAIIAVLGGIGVASSRAATSREVKKGKL